MPDLTTAPSATQPLTHLIFDMGGVLIDLEWQERASQLLGKPLDFDAIHELWISARSVSGFERGELSFEAFGEAFVAEFDLDLSPELVRAEFLEMVRAPKPGCDRCLADLRDRYSLSLLSNTNPAHMGRLRDRYDFFKHFDRLFLSYELGCIKPDLEIFERVLETLDAPPAAVAFFDDSPRNVAAAQSLGIRAFRIDSPQEAAAIVANLDTSPPPVS